MVTLDFRRGTFFPWFRQTYPLALLHGGTLRVYPLSHYCSPLPEGTITLPKSATKFNTFRACISRILIVALLVNAGAAIASGAFAADSSDNMAHSLAGAHHDHGDVDVSSADDPSCFNCVAHCSGITVETCMEVRLEPPGFAPEKLLPLVGISSPTFDEPPRSI